jgi:hypothetical protein
MNDKDVVTRGGRMGMPRSRGAASGLLLILLGVWGAAVPFIGPRFDFAYSLGQEWTTGRGWLQVLPGVVAAVGGLLLLASRNRATAMLGGWLAVVAGAWFVVGRAFAGPLSLGDVGTPVAVTDTKRVWLELTYFYGLGALIVFLGALALGRLSIRSVRDVEYGRRTVATADRTDVVTDRTDVVTDRADRTGVTTAVTAPETAERNTGWRGRLGGLRRHRPHRTTAAH